MILSSYGSSGFAYAYVYVCEWLFSSSSRQNLQAQKSDNQKMKAKLRRLEEDNIKREKQIEELLDPTKVWLFIDVVLVKEMLNDRKKTVIFFSCRDLNILSVW